MHDDTQPTRVYEMTTAIKDGMFPVRWSHDLGYGYGYPIFNFYAPLAYYVGSYIQLAGSDTLTATKLMIAAGLLFAGITMYFLGKSLWGTLGGIVSALFYIYAPYHALNVFVRGAVSETWAYAFVPLAFYGLWKVSDTPKWRWVIVGAIGFAGVILSHNLTAMMITPFYGLMLLIGGIRITRAFRNWSWILLVVMAICGILLAAFYWLPAIGEMKYTNVQSQISGGSNFHDHFVCPEQLWDSPWGFGGSTKGCVDGLSLKVGKVHLILAVLALLLALFFLKTDNRRRNIIYLTSFGLILSLFLMLSYSLPIWDFFKPMAYFQFPWRFLLMASFFSSILAGSVIFMLQQRSSMNKIFTYASWGVAVIVIGLVMFQNTKLFTPQTINAKTEADYTDTQKIRWDISKISDEYMPKNFAKPKKEDDLIKSKVTSVESIPTVSVMTDKTQRLTASVTTNREVQILLNIAYFPSWHVFVDGKESPYEKMDDGLLLTLPQGEHTVAAQFVPTDVEKIANWASLAGILLLFAGIIVSWKGKFL